MSKPASWPHVAQRFAIVACFACWAAGCAPSAEESIKADAARSAAPPQVDAKPIAVELVDRPAYDEAIAANRGRVVIADFWATWCLPCMQQLPHTIELAQRYGDRVAVATVNMDDVDAQSRVEQVLGDRDAAAVVNLMVRNGGSPQAMEDFEIPGGALPHYKLYDRTGKLRRTFEVDPAAEKQFSTADIDAAVEELLGEP
jgi:thiol-disulfide isomerase/thioredoxin